MNNNENGRDVVCNLCYIFSVKKRLVSDRNNPEPRAEKLKLVFFFT